MQDLQRDLLSGYDIEIHAYEDCSIEKIPSFLKQIDEITALNDESIIQLLDCDYICGRRHLNQGISQAIKAFNEKENFANDNGLEICVRLSAQKQISQALKLLGIKEKGNIIVIYINATDKQIELTEELLSDRNDELIEMYDEDSIIKAYDLYDDVNVVDAICERIALLALQS
ncbi:MAG: KEOPS complex subunit Cgi121 [Methanosphaera sp.]|nr:KEOPS complex subunit Cgi121 [Methanosphaera sp.]